MTDARLESLLQTLRRRWPRYRVVLRPLAFDDDPALRHFVHVLDVPDDELVGVMDESWELAAAVYGNDEPPLLLTPIGIAASAKHFPRTNAEAG
jgi:hypothetical protein